MTMIDTAATVDWLGACRQASGRVEQLLTQVRGVEERAVETGTLGAGGDRTLVLDRSAEEIVFDELMQVHEAGADFTAISEERGEQRFGAVGGSVRVVIDPIDGSLNAKRDALHYALSVAVADGDTMEDVVFGFVHDFGAGEQWWARRGAGAWHASGAHAERRLDPHCPERRSYDDRLEVVGVEAADPRLMEASIGGLVDVAYRIRVVGAIALTLCQVAAARFDGMLTLRRCRGVDAAAGQLIVREAGGLVAFPGCPTPLGAPLDATATSPLVAARSAAGLHALAEVAR